MEKEFLQTTIVSHHRHVLRRHNQFYAIVSTQQDFRIFKFKLISDQNGKFYLYKEE